MPARVRQLPRGFAFLSRSPHLLEAAIFVSVTSILGFRPVHLYFPHEMPQPSLEARLILSLSPNTLLHPSAVVRLHLSGIDLYELLVYFGN